MTAVFGHGRLRLYLLKLLDDGPKHGYELIRLLENLFLGLYVPSAGTIYPRLQRMEAEGLVTHTAAGGRKIYQITDAGRAELRQRAGELAALESDIQSSVADLTTLAGEIQAEVRDSISVLKRELRVATRETRRGGREPGGPAAGTRPTYPGPSVSPGGHGPEPERDAEAEFDQRLTAFVAEVRDLVRGLRLTDSQLRTATRMLDGVVDGLRRLLR